MSSLRRVVRAGVLLSMAIAVVGACDASAAAASTFFVNGATGNDTNPCTSAGAPCKTIGAAVTKSELAADTATIEVAAGAYVEEVLLVHQADADITINGAGSGPAGTVIVGAGGPAIVSAVPNEGHVTLNHLRMMIPNTDTAPAFVAVEVSPVLNDVAVEMQDAASTVAAMIIEKASGTLDHVTVSGSWTGSVLIGLGSVTIANSSLLSNASALILVPGEKGGHSDLIQDSTVSSSSASSHINVLASGVNLTVDSSLLLGGNPYDIEWVHETTGKPRRLTIASSTLDAGVLGSNDSSPVNDVFAATNGPSSTPALVQIEGSILLEQQSAVLASASDQLTVECSHSDVPNQKQVAKGTEGTINCANGENGNTTSTPASLFITPGSNYSLLPSSSAVDSVPAGAISLPFGLTPSTTDLLGNPRTGVAEIAGVCTAVQDKGALELQGNGCRTPVPVCPASTSGCGPAKLALAGITNLTISPNTFWAAPSGATIAKTKKGKKVYGATVSYNDSQAATTTFTVLQSSSGRMQGKTCKKSSKANKHGKPCTIYTALGSFTHADTVGANKFHFSGRLKGKKLGKGSYKLRAVPHNATGNGTSVSAGFKIK